MRKKLSLVLSVDVMLGREALVVLLQLSRVLLEKREKLPFQLQGWVNGKIILAVARTYSQIIRGAWLPSPLWDQEPGRDLEL